MGQRVHGWTVRGPLAPWAPGFAQWLTARGYRPSAVRHRLWLLAAMSLWLQRRGLEPADLTDERALLFVAERRAAGLKTWAADESVRLPLEYLREVGAVPHAVAILDDGLVAQILAGYREYLRLERGLASSTIEHCLREARLFLRQLPDRLEIGQLTAADVSAFLARECPRRTGTGAKTLTSKFRPFLRYLHVSGLIASPLVWAVPRTASLRDRSLPRAVDPSVVARLLDSCDRQWLLGRRDYAILLLLVRLGLRAGEVASMRLDEVDWRHGQMLIHGKGNRQDLLPLPVDVGQAIASYLLARGRDDIPAVFVKAQAPAGPIDRTVVKSLVRRACQRSGVPHVSPHQLRSTAATGMLANGASLEAIAQVLRHRDTQTTAIYATVDHVRLRPLARQWPEVTR
jgi:integrase/recombinase XerD